jgi:cytochrome c553
MNRVLVALLLALGAFPSVTRAQSIEQKAQVCTTCHGEHGVPVEQSFPVPVIWGQNPGYLFFELRDFKTGARKNEQMTPVADALEHDDLMPLAQYFAKQQWPKLQQPQPPPDVAAAAQHVNAAVVCTNCHQAGFMGDNAQPRRPGPRLSAKDHDRRPQRRPRQQCGHDKLVQGAHGSGHRRHGGVARGEVSLAGGGARNHLGKGSGGLKLRRRIGA